MEIDVVLQSHELSEKKTTHQSERYGENNGQRDERAFVQGAKDEVDHAKAQTLYDSLRQRQKDYPQRLADGETLEALAEETWQLLCDNA